MARNATKAANNVFYLARKEAEKLNDRLGSREGAEEETGIDRTRLARIEGGVLVPHPEEVWMMAQAYQAPQLCNHYCARLCPLELAAEGTAGTLEGAYVGDRAFTATVRDSLVGGRELIIYEGTTEFLRVSYEAGENEVAALEAAVAAATKDFIFTPEHEATGALKDITQEAFTAGTNPTVSATEYSAAFEALEPFTWNVLCIDTDDVATHLLLDAFLDRIYDAGAYPVACIPAKLESELEERFTTAKSYNDPKIIYVLNSATNAAGVTYKARRAGVQLGMLFIDEPPFLDADGTEAYADALVSMARRNPRMRILAISHDPTMKARFSQNIIVSAGENGSTVEME